MKLTFSETGVMRLMESAFSSSSTFISEIMQNARRARATEIRIEVIEIAGKYDMSFQDDGIGVSDFTNMMTVALSGWSQEVQDNDKPFGAGFLSAIMACESGEVISNGKRLRWNTKELVNGGEAEVDDYPAGLKGTVINLFSIGKGIAACTNEKLASRVRTSAYGFPIEVYLNGREVGRGGRLYSANTFSVTQLKVEGLGVIQYDPSGGYSSKYFLYLQGLPINRPEGFGSRELELSGSISPSFAVHLDPRVYEGRMPDREVLRNFSRADVEEKINEAMPALAEKVFNKNEKGLSNIRDFELVEKFAPWLIKNCVALPGQLFNRFVGVYPTDCVYRGNTNEDEWTSTYPSPVTPDTFKGGKAVLLDFLPDWSECNHGGWARLFSEAVLQGTQILANTRHTPNRKNMDYLPDWLPVPLTTYYEGRGFLVATPIEGVKEVVSKEVFGEVRISYSNALHATLCPNGFCLEGFVTNAEGEKQSLGSYPIRDWSWYDREEKSLFFTQLDRNHLITALKQSDEFYHWEYEDADHGEWDYKELEEAAAELTLALTALFTEDELEVEELLISRMREVLRDSAGGLISGLKGKKLSIQHRGDDGWMVEFITG